MLNGFGRRKKSGIDIAIDQVLHELNNGQIGTEDYSKRLVYLERLVETRQKSQPAKISRDTIVIVTGNVLGIVLIVFAEQNHVVVSKALSFVLKPKNRDISI